MESLKRFKYLSYAEYLFTEGRIILSDVPLGLGRREALTGLRTVDGNELIILDTERLAEKLEPFLEELIKQEKNTLLVFPGNGANYPRSASRICRKLGGVGVYAKRVWTPGSDPFAMAGSITPEVFMNLMVRTIMVVDDVISSGQTMYKLYRNNEWRFPGAKWIAATWVAQIPQMKALSGVNGYTRTVAAYVVEGPNRKRVPINSLSTLIEQPDIAENYARRHFIDWQCFLDLLRYDPWIDDFDHHTE